MKNNNKTLILFYILVVYVFASFLWWSYLLLDKNYVVFKDQAALQQLYYNRDHHLPNDADDYYHTAEFLKLEKNFNRQKWMIFGEGLVFLLILGAATYYLWTALRRELILARQQHNFMLSITHELKSPLASIKLSLQTLLRKDVLLDKYKRLVNNSLEDVDRLDILVNNILFAAKMESPAYSIQKQEEDVSDLVRRIVERAKIENKGKVNFTIDIQNDILLAVDKTSFASAVLNLIENAIKYSEEGAEIAIHLHKKQEEVIFEVRDNGFGIAEEERKNVFKKFYRIGNEETRSTQGTGLGLFIVERTIQKHGGTITIKDNEPQGTIIQLIFPSD